MLLPSWPLTALNHPFVAVVPRYWPAFGTITHYVDRTSTKWDFVERPQVAQMVDGTPLTFFAGHGYGGIHTLAIMFCQANDTDADCVTTVQ